ncbi:MAG: Mth938-like domain-containing protein [Anaerolineae bacterium]|jgi:hypothetical protein
MAAPRIEDYRFGQIVVDGQTYEKDLIILPERIISGWWREKGHKLRAADLDAVLEAKPDVLVVGRGAYGRMSISNKAERALEQAGIELIARPTKEAIRTYNQLRQERRAAAALHLTC